MDRIPTLGDQLYQLVNGRTTARAQERRSRRRVGKVFGWPATVSDFGVRRLDRWWGTTSEQLETSR